MSAICGPRRAQAQCEYQATVIQPAPCPIFGIVNLWARGISNAGHVVGWRWNCSLNDDIAYLWTAEGGMVDIPFPAGTTSRRAEDVNGSGRIVGSANFPNDGLGVIAFLYDSAFGQPIDLGTVPGGNVSEALAVNDLGQVVGYGQHNVTGNPPFTPFLWQEGVMTVLQLPSGPQAVASDINDKSQVVGWMGTSNVIGGDSHAYIWQAAVVTDMGHAPGAFASEATAINNAGQVLVVAKFQYDQSSPVVVRSFLWDAGRWIDLGLLPGFDRCAGIDLNDAGEVVGYCTKSAQPSAMDPFVWHNGVMASLDDLLVTPGAAASIAWAVNQDGQITAIGGYLDDPAALLLTPVNKHVGDLDHDCSVGFNDFVMLLAAWGPCHHASPCEADLDADGAVGVVDFLILLGNWG
jgi:probable HAF family extracellular repeat protein